MPKRGRFTRGPVGLGRMVDRRVLRLVAPEKKFFDNPIATGEGWQISCSGSSAANAVCGPADTTDPDGTGGGIQQNASAQGRIGSKIAIDSISCRLKLWQNYFELSNLFYFPKMIRVVLVLDKQSNGDSAKYNDVFTHPAADPDFSLWTRNLTSPTRFSILYDKVHTLPPPVVQQESATAPTMMLVPAHKIITINKKFKRPLMREYMTGASGGLPSMIAKNEILLFFLPCHSADYPGSSSDDTQWAFVDGLVRLRFTDA